MKHSDGLRVRLQLHTGEYVAEASNPAETLHKDFLGAFGSRLVIFEDNMCRLIIEVNAEFNQYKSQGLLVTVACGGRENLQSFFLGFNEMPVHGKHVLGSFTKWNSATDLSDGIAEDIPMPGPVPHREAASSEWMVGDYYTANPGCVAIIIERGHLTDDRDTWNDYVWGTSDPPPRFKNVATGLPRPVRSEWFVPLKSVNGNPYAFEFRNIAAHELRDIGSNSTVDEEINHNEPAWDVPSDGEENESSWKKRKTLVDKYGEAEYADGPSTAFNPRRKNKNSSHADTPKDTLACFASSKNNFDHDDEEVLPLRRGQGATKEEGDNGDQGIKREQIAGDGSTGASVMTPDTPHNSVATRQAQAPPGEHHDLILDDLDDLRDRRTAALLRMQLRDVLNTEDIEDQLEVVQLNIKIRAAEKRQG